MFWVSTFVLILLPFISISQEWNKVPLQDIRLVREDSKEENDSSNHLLTENPFLGRNDEEDYSWLDDTIKDIAYYLRSHKFNEYDRRYETDAAKAPVEYYAKFPRPPLRALHWEVQQFCEPSFLSCMKYVKRKLKDVALKRADDTAIVIMEQKWTQSNNSEQIKEVNDECLKMREKDNTVADPFQGPIERFQWRTTASYYLCWYTMNEVPDLMHIKENCDNYAYCLDENQSESSGDFRARDEDPFSCATYSFCPDPCCPAIKHAFEPITCDNNEENPCFETNPPGKRRCIFVRSENRNFHDVILNRWNVSCNCSETGYKWSSRYGLCIDVDECGGNAHGCDNNTEICVNLPGSFECACRWGYAWNADENKCAEHNALAVIKKERKEQEQERRSNGTAKSLVKMAFTKLFGSKSYCHKTTPHFLLILSIAVNKQLLFLSSLLT